MLKKLFNPGTYNNNIDLSLLILRLVFGALMITHGWGKWLKLIGDDPIKFSDPLGVGVFASLALAVFAEVFCSMLLIFGAATRLASIPLIITMAVAAFIVHAEDALQDKEMALLYLTVYLAIAISGSGKYALDKFIYDKISKQ
ncbi:MAG: DoxX family protein [Chitinophagales bacterium]